MSSSIAYPLAKVRKLIAQGSVRIKAPASQTIIRDFGWTPDDALDAMFKLKPANYYKSVKHRFIQGGTIDYYKSDKLHKGESVYLHFHILNEGEVDETLVLVSMKDRYRK